MEGLETGLVKKNFIAGVWIGPVLKGLGCNEFTPRPAPEEVSAEHRSAFVTLPGCHAELFKKETGATI